MTTDAGQFVSVVSEDLTPLFHNTSGSKSWRFLNAKTHEQNELREVVCERVHIALSDVNKSFTKSFLLKREFSTLLTESQLSEQHGLRVVGRSSGERWLVPEALQAAQSPQDSAQLILYFDARVDRLSQSAKEEGFHLSEKSLADARDALQKLPDLLKPSIFLVNNGNLRFVWFGDKGEQVGWQFLEAGRIQFVLLDGMEESENRTIGESDLSGAMRHVRAAGLKKIVFRG